MDGVYFIFPKKDSVGFVIQIRQKCLRWFFLCFRGLFGQFGVARKTIYLFGCLSETLVVTKCFW